VDDTLPWRFAISSTRRGMYLLRYLLFTGGLAVGLGVFERLLVPERSGFGLLIGLALGLFVFRGQLRALSWPRLLLSQEHLFLLHKRRATVIPWAAVRDARAVDGQVVLRLATSPQETEARVAESIELDAGQLGTSTAALHEVLGKLVAQPSLRGRLPPDATIRQRLQPTGGTEAGGTPAP
jgi:hypothetical protein